MNVLWPRLDRDRRGQYCVPAYEPQPYEPQPYEAQSNEAQPHLDDLRTYVSCHLGRHSRPSCECQGYNPEAGGCAR